MTSKALERRLQQVESRLGDPNEGMPTLFIMITDFSRPDPDHPDRPVPDFSEAAIIGFMAGNQKLAREPGESLKDLQARAQKLFPHIRVFQTAYRGDHPGREQFDSMAEMT
jgi:hypothetical protein